MSTRMIMGISAVRYGRVNYVNELCPKCGRQTMTQMENKFWCDSCGIVDDRFQDGDRVGHAP